LAFEHRTVAKTTTNLKKILATSDISSSFSNFLAVLGILVYTVMSGCFEILHYIKESDL